MAEPANFPEENSVWKGWPAKDGDPEVTDLPSHRVGNDTISCWRLSWRERLGALLTGRMWLGVMGPQPPVWVSGAYPWSRDLRRRIAADKAALEGAANG